MKKYPAVNFWTRERDELPMFNMNAFHRVDFQSDDIIVGFFTYGNRTAETLSEDDIEFLTAYFLPCYDFAEKVLTYEIVGRDEVHSSLLEMHDMFLRIRKPPPNESE